MTRETVETTRGYIVLSRAWYAEANLRGQDYCDEVHFGRMTDEGGETWGAALRWYRFAGGNYESAPRLEVFDDAWSPELVLVVAALAAELSSEVVTEWGKRRQRATVPAVCALLERLGYQDKTPVNDPHAKVTP